MKKLIKTVVIIALLAVFVYSGGRLLVYYMEYREQSALYETAAESYIKEQPEAQTDEENNGNEGKCPIEVDFDSLLAECGDIVGWLYCEDTNINYPLAQGEDNNYYLRHSYTGEYMTAGTLFVDAANRPGFVDSKMIIYGHNMKSGIMFAHLRDWTDQEFFDAHPVMWLLTPEQNYKIELIGGHLTSAVSDDYMIFTGPCPEFDEYLEEVVRASDVQSNVETPRDGHYVMLSTCEYDYENARYALFGRLIPAAE